MGRPITLVTAQWADMPLTELCKKTSAWGFDGLELACWGDHFEVDKVLENDSYVREKRGLLEKHNLKCWAISAHLVGQAVCDPIDERHKRILPDRIWGDGNPGKIQERAAEEMKNTARAARALGINQVTGFTGSAIWHKFFPFPPVTREEIDAGFKDFADRWRPILDVFKKEKVKFGLEVHPTEIAYDFVTAGRALEAIDRHPAFGFNMDPSHFPPQFLDPAAFIEEYAERIFHVHVKDSRVNLNGRTSILASHLDFGDGRRGWDFVSVGRGDVNWDQFIRALNRINYAGPLSIEWEDCGMDREHGAQEALQYLRRNNFAPASAGFDSAFQKSE